MPEYANLTALLVETAQPPEKGQRFIRDTQLSGMALRITAAGAKSFIVEVWINGRSRRETIGRADRLELKDARRLAKAKIGTYAQGVDSVARKRSERARSITLGEVFTQYLAGRKLAAKSVKDYRWIVGELLRDWKGRPVASITRDMAQRAHARITRESGPATANKALRVARALLNYAAATLEDEHGNAIITDNPVTRLSATKAWNRVDRRRTLLRAHELPAWWSAVEALADDPRDEGGHLLLDGEGRQIRKGRKAEVVRDYLQFLILTGLRREEATRLRWADVSLAGGYFTIPETKNHEPHTLPLSDYLKAMLERRKKEATNTYVFPGEGKAGHLVEPRKQMAKVTKASGIAFTLHDLRRTFVTLAEGLDIPAYALKRLLNHKGGADVTAGYIVVDTERLRVPMQRITDYVLKAAGVRKGAAVVPLANRSATGQNQEI